MVRQWKRQTDNLTETQIRERFHQADTNGNGRLTPKEFKKLLHKFGIEMTEENLQILISRFDVDGDGEIDLNEFRKY